MADQNRPKRPQLGLSFGATSKNGMAPPAPPRRRRVATPPQPGNIYRRQTGGNDILDARYGEVIKKSGILKLPNANNTECFEVTTDISDLEPLGELGSGTCGLVVKMRHKRTSHMMAVKQMRKSGNRDENRRIIMDLDVVLKSYDCKHIVQCYGYIITQDDVWICMEVMATCLDKLLKRLRAVSPRPQKTGVPETIIGKVTVSTLLALHYLKEKHGVMHRDIKPSNILIDERGRIKLCDFGIAGRLVDSRARTRSAGCAAYLAPERIDPPDPTQPDYDVRADVWALGITLVELATGEFPYKNCKSDFDLLSKVLKEDAPTLPQGCGFSMDFCGFVNKCLTKDVKHRPKYVSLLEQPFVVRYTQAPVDVAQWYAGVAAATTTPAGTPLTTPSSPSPFACDFSPNTPTVPARFPAGS